jgi:hypothetical protein
MQQIRPRPAAPAQGCITRVLLHAARAAAAMGDPYTRRVGHRRAQHVTERIFPGTSIWCHVVDDLRAPYRPGDRPFAGCRFCQVSSVNGTK